MHYATFSRMFSVEIAQNDVKNVVFWETLRTIYPTSISPILCLYMDDSFKSHSKETVYISLLIIREISKWWLRKYAAFSFFLVLFIYLFIYLFIFFWCISAVKSSAWHCICEAGGLLVHLEGESKGIQPRLDSEVEGIDLQESSCHLAGLQIHFLLSSQFCISIKIEKRSWYFSFNIGAVMLIFHYGMLKVSR